MLSELGTSCHGKTATGKGYTKMLVIGGGGRDDGTGLSSTEMLSEASTKRPCKYDASIQHPSQPAGPGWGTAAAAMRAHFVPRATHEHH